MKTCGKIKRKLSCYLDKELTERDEPFISRHLRQCPECQEELNLLLKVSRVLQADEATESFPDFEAGFWRRVAEVEEGKGLSLESLLGWLKPWPLLPQTAVIVLIGVFLGIGVGEFFSMSLAKQEFVSSLDLVRFSNFQPDSLSRAYQKMSNCSGD